MSGVSAPSAYLPFAAAARVLGRRIAIITSASGLIIGSGAAAN
ncbi:MAG TPA: hypothetical protein VHB79_19460 [Polyangiaceae bacterium]|nr:hypothetical protein [Polyangiaceae bacterium]